MTPQKTNLARLQKILKVKFKNPALLNQALVHRSSLNESKNIFSESNERFEFLGDAALELWSSTVLFSKFPRLAEGELTNLRSLIVRTENLASIASNLNLGSFLYLSRGEETHGGRQNSSILADSLEALIGAVYLDRGLPATNKMLDQMFAQSIEELSLKTHYKDPKSLFQEIAQAKDGATPLYQIISETGPDHNKTFEAGVYVKDKLVTSGKGNSKQKAEEAAAINAIKMTDNLL
jgi:ribonuclease-3